jgi:hypothetical protein
MSDLICRYAGDRDEAIVSYLYDEIDPDTRTRFADHLATCARCRSELSQLKGLRSELAKWSPPEPAGLADRARSREAATQQAVAVGARKQLPVWAQFAAAVLVIGVAAGIANLEVRYDAAGLRVTTGWSHRSEAATPSAGDAALRAELAAFEQRMRGELNARPAAAPQPAVAAAGPATAAEPPSADVLRRVRAIVDESERRQQRELALRIGEAMREVTTERQGDLMRIERSLGAIQTNTGVEMMRQRETINNLLVRTSLQK